MSFAELGLSAEVLRAVSEQGYTTPTPIQLKAIPEIMAGRDILAAAQTGTGKTAAFTLPILARLARHANSSMSPAMHPVRVLILTPTRELADQVAGSVDAYAKYMPIRHTVVFGGVNIDPQKAALMKGVEILVATPGRLLDHIEQKTVQLNRVEILVLDEADRMLDMGFILDIRRIMGMLPAQRQTLLFSATFSPEIKKLSADFMHEPQLIEVARQNATNAHIEQVVYPVDAYRKRALLVKLLKERQLSQVLVFCRTKQGADQLARELKRDDIAVDAIHGDKSQQARLETLQAFKQGEVRVLVATDVAARGLDIEELPFVVNYELSSAPEDYVHRIGRTGRAGASGIAISLMGQDEERLLEAIEALTKQSIKQEVMPGFWPSWRPRPATHQSGTEPAAFLSRGNTEPRQLPHCAVRLINSARDTREIPALLLPPRYTR